MEYQRILLVTLVLLVTQLDLISGQNGTVSDSESERGAVEQAMVPFYSMTNSFLDIVQPLSKNWTLLYLIPDVIKKDGNADIDWKDYVNKYIGVVICLAIGVVFVVFMPIVGLILCCCRCCCGRCGAHAESKYDKNDRCSFYVCSLLLFIFSIFILAGTILAFISNEYIWQQTVHNDKGFMYDTRETLKYIKNYEVDAKNDLVRLATDVKAKVDSVIVDVKKVPRDVADTFIESIDVANVLESAKDLQTSVQSIKTDLTTVDTSLSQLRSSGTTLVNQLNNLIPQMSATLQGCPSTVSSQCDSLRTKIGSLQGVADFSKVDSVTNFLNDLRNVQLTDVYDRAVNEYRKIENRLDASIANEVQKIESTGNDIKMDIDKIRDDVTERMTDAADFSSVDREIDSFQPQVQEYFNYVKYAGIAIGCCLLITGVLFFLGLMFGCFGSDPDSESACNKATGANLLMGGIVWAFVFSWILMIVVIVLFASGGIIYTDGCRYMVHVGETPESIQGLNAITVAIQKSVKSSDSDLNITSIILKCKANKGAYDAFNLSQFIDIDKEISVENYNLQEQVNNVKRLRLRIPEIDIISDENYQQLTDLSNANLQNLDFQSFYTELAYDFTNQNLGTLASEAESLVSQIQAAGDSNKANVLQSQANELSSIQDNTVSPMISRKNQLEVAVRSLERSIKGTTGSRVFSDYVTKFKQDLDALQIELDRARNNNNALTPHIEAEAQRIYDDIKNYLDNNVKNTIKNEIGQCGGVYHRVNYLVTTSMCERFINPFNAFWFSVGWCLFFFIPSIIVAWDLNSQYRRTGYYGPEKGFEDHSFRY